MGNYKNLTIIAHLPHYKLGNSEWVAYEPYVREIELWAQLYERVKIYTDIKKGSPKGNNKTLPANCKVKPIYVQSGPGIKNNVIRLLQLPYAFVHILLIMLNSKTIHLRSPGITTIIANLINKVINKPTIIKWATHFKRMPIVAPIIHWEMSLLQNPPSNSKVLIYSEGTHQNHIPFIPALMSKSEIDKIEVKNKDLVWEPPFTLLCVGRLFVYKDFDFVITGLTLFKIQHPEVKWHLNIIGDGAEKSKLLELVSKGNITKNVSFHGALDFNTVLEFYHKSHIAIMPGRYEGWGKVINEAWATNTIPLVVNEGNAPYVVKMGGNAGVLYEHDKQLFSDKLFELVNYSNNEIKSLSKLGREANYGMTLESFQKGIKQIMDDLLK